MKQKLLLLLFFIGTSIGATAQFAPVGSVWNYVDWHPWLWPESHNVKITIEKDTLIQGKTYSKFDNGSFKTNDSGRVYYFSNNQHHMLFDYNAKQGDTIEVECNTHHPDSIYPLSIRIDSIYFINDLQLNDIKAYLIHSVTPLSPWIENRSIVYEKILIGENTADYTVLSEDLFPIIIEARSMYFYCYREPNGYHFLLTDSGLCDIVSTTEIEQIQQYVSVYPNPSKGKLFFRNDTPYPTHHLEFYDLSGKLIYHSTPVDITEFDTSLLPNGNYWVVIELSNHNRILKKATVAN